MLVPTLLARQKSIPPMEAPKASSGESEAAVVPCKGGQGIPFMSMRTIVRNSWDFRRHHLRPRSEYGTPSLQFSEVIQILGSSDLECHLTMSLPCTWYTLQAPKRRDNLSWTELCKAASPSSRESKEEMGVLCALHSLVIWSIALW